MSVQCLGLLGFLAYLQGIETETKKGGEKNEEQFLAYLQGIETGEGGVGHERCTAVSSLPTRD